jgi:hypothetical protein
MLYLTGEKWKYIITNTLPSSISTVPEYVIERWEWAQKPDSILNHFKLPDWDSCKPSPVVAKGKIVSYRIIRRV